MSEECVGVAGDESEGPRVRALREALNQTTSRVLGGLKPSLFARCFPSLSKVNDAAMEAIRESVVQAIQTAICEDLAVILDEDVVRPLEELGTVVKNYSGPKEKPAWRPPGDPANHMTAHDAKVLQHEKQRLLESLGTAKSSSHSLLQEVKDGRKECQENQKEIQRHVAAIKELVEIRSTVHNSDISELFQDTITASD